MYIDKFKDKDQHEEENYYTDKDGCTWEGERDFIQGGILGFCCCGLPEENLEYIAKSLRLLHDFTNQSFCYEEFVNKGIELHGSSQGSYFMWYFLSSKNLTEHGGSVPGWLKEEGIKIMEDIESMELYIE